MPFPHCQILQIYALLGRLKKPSRQAAENFTTEDTEFHGEKGKDAAGMLIIRPFFALCAVVVFLLCPLTAIPQLILCHFERGLAFYGQWR
jgi:hypothetical protein